MTNRQTFQLALKIPQRPDTGHLFGFKEHDSYCNRSCFLQGGHHA